MSVKVRIRGAWTEKLDVADLPRIKSNEIELKPRKRVRIGASREVSGIAEIADVENDDIALLRFNDGFELWMRADELPREFGKTGARASVEEGAEGVAGPVRRPVLCVRAPLPDLKSHYQRPRVG